MQIKKGLSYFISTWVVKPLYTQKYKWEKLMVYFHRGYTQISISFFKANLS